MGIRTKDTTEYFPKKSTKPKLRSECESTAAEEDSKRRKNAVSAILRRKKSSNNRNNKNKTVIISKCAKTRASKNAKSSTISSSSNNNNNGLADVNNKKKKLPTKKLTEVKISEDLKKEERKHEISETEKPEILKSTSPAKSSQASTPASVTGPKRKRAKFGRKRSRKKSNTEAKKKSITANNNNSTNDKNTVISASSTNSTEETENKPEISASPEDKSNLKDGAEKDTSEREKSAENYEEKPISEISQISETEKTSKKLTLKINLKECCISSKDDEKADSRSPKEITLSNVNAKQEEKIETAAKITPQILKSEGKRKNESLLKNMQSPPEDPEVPPTKVEVLKAEPVVSTKGGNNLKLSVVNSYNASKKGMRNMMERTNKILERSKNCTKQARNVIKHRILPARASARLCVRKNSGEKKAAENKCMDRPLRTVELIKRPLELRDPATKLLYLASLSLYPKIDPDSDTTPIVIINEQVSCPGSKKQKHRSIELPLYPSYRVNQPTRTSQCMLEPDSEEILEKSSLLPERKKLEFSNFSKKNECKMNLNNNTCSSNDLTIIPTHQPIFRSAEISGETLAKNSQNSTIKDLKNNSSSLLMSETKKEEFHEKTKTKPAVQKVQGKCSTLNSSNIKANNSNGIIIIKRNGNNSNNDSPTSTVKSSILEELMRNPGKKPQLLEKPTLQGPFPNTTNHNNFSVNINRPVTMTVPLQPAPGLSLPATTTIMSKDQQQEQFPASKKSRAKTPLLQQQQQKGFQLPMPLPIPLPPGILSLASFPKKLPVRGKVKRKGGGAVAAPPPPTKVWVGGALKGTQGPSTRIFKGSEGPSATVFSGPDGRIFKGPEGSLTKIHKGSEGSSPTIFKGSELRSFKGPEGILKGPEVRNLNVSEGSPKVISRSLVSVPICCSSWQSEALDLCVNRSGGNISLGEKVKKPANGGSNSSTSSSCGSKSLLKPLNSAVEYEDKPLDLVLSAGKSLSSSSGANSDERTGTIAEEQKKQLKNGDGNLENVKQMLAKLHTKIAPAVNGVQLITIE